MTKNLRPLTRNYVFQDGGDFYREDIEADSTTFLWSAPFTVADHDLNAASRARAEFMTWCEMNDIQAVF